MLETPVSAALDLDLPPLQEFIVRREWAIYARTPEAAALLALDLNDNDPEFPVLEVVQYPTGETTVVDTGRLQPDSSHTL